MLDYIAGDSTVWEQEPLQKLAHDGALVAYKHQGFWQPMDTLRDKMILEELWVSGKAPWKVWDDCGQQTTKTESTGSPVLPAGLRSRLSEDGKGSPS